MRQQILCVRVRAYYIPTSADALNTRRYYGFGLMRCEKLFDILADDTDCIKDN